MIGEYITWEEIEEKFGGKYVVLTNTVPKPGGISGGILDSVFDNNKEMEDRAIELCKKGIRNYSHYILTYDERCCIFVSGTYLVSSDGTEYKG